MYLSIALLTNRLVYNINRRYSCNNFREVPVREYMRDQAVKYVAAYVQKLVREKSESPQFNAPLDDEQLAAVFTAAKNRLSNMMSPSVASSNSLDLHLKGFIAMLTDENPSIGLGFFHQVDQLVRISVARDVEVGCNAEIRLFHVMVVSAHGWQDIPVPLDRFPKEYL